MPGIFGIVDLDQDASACPSERFGIISQMAAAMCYEPAYVADIVSCPGVNACVGWVGWSSNAPVGRRTTAPTRIMLTAGEPVVTVASTADSNDECYVAGAGARELAAQIHEHGVDGLQGVQGAFAGFFVDQRLGNCVLFNDRYGVERLFIHADRSRILFASEAKAILAVAPSSRAIDEFGLAEWLTCGCTMGTRSLFRNVEVLAGGTAITFKPDRGAVRTRYFDRARLEQLPPASPHEFVENFAASLRSAVNKAIGTPPGAAISLTGGLDSRLIIACLDAPSRSVPCYTFGSMYRPTMDVSVAAAVAAECQQPHQILELDRCFVESIDKHFQHSVYVSDGYLGLAGSAELYLNRQARLISPIRVTGNWGGELMRGVRAFKFRLPKGDFLQRSVSDQLASVGQGFESAGGGHPLSYTLFHQLPDQGYGRYAVERSQIVMRSPFLANDVVDALYRAPAATRASIDTVANILSRRPGLIAIATDTGRLGHSPRPLAFLRQTYRRALVKSEYLTSHGAPDWMAGLSARLPLLERWFLGRDKFQHFRLWMRNELADFVRDVLFVDAGKPLSPWFDMRRLSTMVADHIDGRANYTDEIDKAMTVAMLHKTLLSNEPMHGPVAVDVRRDMALEASR